jgi:maltose alpha-D-glucosyltransferase / alpha-amylase
MIDDLWYKNAIVYSLDVETFMDGNGDGIGDFRGLRNRIDYLAGLGVTCLWLLPFYPSPNRDNGYDVTDYYGVDPRLGDLGDFVEFSRQAHIHGIRIVVDLVANHTSDQHPWFQAARRDPSSPYRDYYVWSAEEPPGAREGMVFPGQQQRIWSYDEVAGAYYFHRFFEFQPDLNTANPAVREEIEKVMGFWLELGVSGFRVDAVPFLLGIDRPDDTPDPFGFLDELRQFLSWRRGDAVLLAEANVTMDEVKEYFADGTRMHLVFDFPANQNLFFALASGDATPLREALASAPDLHPMSQWANFLRNHDELDLGRLAEADRQRVFAAMGPEPAMQLFERGLRRRLAPMLDGDMRRLELAYSLLLGLPGTPVLWYGEEIGMGEDLDLEGRDSVRTPMQWSDEPHGGFTRGDQPFRPVLERGRFGYRSVNVAAQRRDPDSLLNTLERMIRLRKETPEIGWGDWRVIETGAPAVLGLRFEWRGKVVVLLHNVGDAECEVELAHDDIGEGPLVDLIDGERDEIDRAGHRLRLEPYGVRWLRVGEHDAATVGRRGGHR